MNILRLTLLLFYVSLALTGFSQTIDTLVDVGGHRLHVKMIRGQGTPIIFESGAGNDGTVWKDILTPLHVRTNAPLITYDRAGFGQSGIDTANTNITNEVKDLELALKKLGFKEKYFFVAHSLGGNYVMKFIANNPSNTIGAVCIDIVSPKFMTPKRAAYTKNLFIDSLEAIKKESIGFYHLVLNYENTSEVMRQAAPLINVPLTIIASGITPFEGKVRQNFINSLKDFALQKKNRKYILAKNAEHYVFYDEPQLVIDEIVTLYQQVNK